MIVLPDAFLNRFTKRNFSELPLIRGRLDWVECVRLHSAWGSLPILLDEQDDSLNNTLMNYIVIQNTATYTWGCPLMLLKALPHFILLLLAGVGLLELPWHRVLNLKTGFIFSPPLNGSNIGLRKINLCKTLVVCQVHNFVSKSSCNLNWI